MRVRQGRGQLWAEAEGRGRGGHRAFPGACPSVPWTGLSKSREGLGSLPPCMGQVHSLAHRASLAAGSPSSPRRKSPAFPAGALSELAAYKAYTITPTPPHLNDPTSFITKISQNSSHSSHTVFNTNLIPVERTKYSDNRMFGIVNTPNRYYSVLQKYALRALETELKCLHSYEQLFNKTFSCFHYM